MRRIALALIATVGLVGAASAADMPARGPVYKAPVAMYAPSWTGFYIGAHIGGAFSNDDGINIGTGATGGTDNNSFIGGGQIGYNWQAGNWVFGIEADISAAGNNDNGFIGPVAFTNDTNYYATVAGRLGYAWDSWLLYIKGGAAFSDADFTFGAFSGSNDRNGYVLGVGIESMFWNNWSWKLEYNYLDFDSERFVTPVGVFDVESEVHLVKFGINYRFGWGGPVVAKY